MVRNPVFHFAHLCTALIVAVGVMASPDLAMAKKPATKPLKIMVYGDSGIVGLALVDEALRRGHKVTLVVGAPENVTKSDKNLAVVKGDVTDLRDVGRKIASADVVIVAASSDQARFYTTAANSVVTAARIVGAFAPPIIWIGDSAALEDEGGKRLIATLPPASRTGGALGQTQALTYFRAVDDMLWSYLTPPLEMTPGKRTRKFRIGDGHVLKDANGISAISGEDLAVAAIDEAEKPQHNHAQFTVAY
jgi:putative NADH-flavin reductase